MDIFRRIVKFVRPKFVRYPTDYVDNDGEKIIQVIRKHVIYLAKKLVFLFLFYFLLPVIVFFLFDLESISKVLSSIGGTLVLAIYFGFGAAYFLYYYILWYQDSFIFTTFFIFDIDQKSMFGREVSKVGWERVEDVTFNHKGFFDVILNIGYIKVSTSNVEVGIEIGPVSNPQMISKMISEMAKDLADTRTQAITNEELGQITKKEAQIEYVKNQLLNEMSNKDKKDQLEKLPDYLKK